MDAEATRSPACFFEGFGRGLTNGCRHGMPWPFMEGCLVKGRRGVVAGGAWGKTARAASLPRGVPGRQVREQ